MGTGTAVSGRRPADVEEPSGALVADVSESCFFENLADMADPALFHSRVHTGFCRNGNFVPAAGTADGAASCFFRDADLDSVFVRAALPVPIFCSVCLHPFRGRFGMGKIMGKKNEKNLQSGKRIIYCHTL